MKKFYLIFFGWLLLLTVSLMGEDWSQAFLSLKPTGVEEFLKTHPEYDGRGTIIFIFDTGVDQGIDGLTTTSTGETKVIDVQDFTGQGDIDLFEGEKDEEDGVVYILNEDKNYKIAGVDKLEYKSLSGDYLIGALEEKLWMNSSSKASDVNENGSFDDKFILIAFETEQDGDKFWVIYFDTNGDGTLADEKPLRDYKINFDSFTIPNESGLCKFTFGLNIFPNNKKVTFHFDDGAHGTHCAGIASGNRIGEGQLNGVAPGSYIISCKLGNNNFSGGATVTESMKKAFLYADQISRERKEPCVINMSFGIGSEIEGQSEMEKFIDDLVDTNPYLYICTSNGNEGPGLSTAGLPSSSPSVLSSGAVLTKEIGCDLYGAMLESDIILYFSSRGGEVNKPDIVSPGACTSTVPNWENWDRYWGTSMASPYSAGVVSLLLSAALVEFPDVKIPSGLLFKVIRESAVKMSGYSHLDQGGGYINVINAYNLLKKHLAAGEEKNYENYTITSVAPNMPYGKSSSLFIRNGKFITGKETFSFVVDRKNFQKKNKFYRLYNLESDSDWLIPIQKNTYIRNDQSTYVQVKFDVSKMQKPGLYSGKIFGYRKGSDKILEFELLASVIIPHEINEKCGKLSFEGKLSPGRLDHYFVDVPAGTPAMRVVLTSPEGKYTSSKVRVHDPDGRKFLVSSTLNANEDTDEIEKTFYNLEPGVYEIIATAFFTAKDSSNYKLTVEFENVKRVDNSDLSFEKDFIEMINETNRVKDYTISGKLLGVENTYEIKLDGTDKHEIQFSFNEGESEKEFQISLSKEDYNKLTDFAVQIYDESGRVLEKEGIGYKDGKISLKNKYGTDAKYTLSLNPGFAHIPGELNISVKEITKFSAVSSIKLTSKGKSTATLYPSIKSRIYCSFEKPHAEVTEGSKVYGEIQLTPKNKNEITIELPVYFKF